MRRGGTYTSLDEAISGLYAVVRGWVESLHGAGAECGCCSGQARGGR